MVGNTPAAQLKTVSWHPYDRKMITSLIIGVSLSILLLAPYFLYQFFVRKNASPLRTPSARKRDLYRRLEDIVSTRSRDIRNLHWRLVFYREVASLFIIISVTTMFVSVARRDINAAIIGWMALGLFGACWNFLAGIDARATEVTYRKRFLLDISPRVYLAIGDEARRYGTWMIIMGIFWIIFSISSTVFIVHLLLTRSPYTLSLF